MKTVRKIFLRDINKLRTNVIAIIVVLGICILPSLYAWFNIAAIWDPYGNTGDMPVAVVNQDQGSELKGLEIKVGDQIVTNLKSNKKMGWDFVTHKEAMDGIHQGKYYAVVAIPKDFSKDMISFATGKMKRPEIIYYVNEKKNGIAPKITDKGIETIQSQVNSSFVGTMATYVTDFIKVGSENTSVTKEDVVKSVNQTIDTTITNLTDLKNNISSFQANLESLSSLMDASNALTGSVNGGLDNIYTALNKNLASIKTLHSQIDASKYPDLDKVFVDTENRMTSILATIDGATAGVSNTGGVFQGLSQTINSSNKSLAASINLIDSSIKKLNKFKEGNQAFNISDNFMDALNEAIKDPKEVGDFMASPVKIKTEKVYPVYDYGSTMSPFYTTLAIWVGGVIMVAIMKVNVEEDEKIKKITLRQAYLGRFGVFLIIGLIQALIIGLGDLYFLGMQATNPGLFIGTCLITAFVFTLIIYTLTVSFGSIGKALCVIWLVIQVAGSGGTYPIEVLPDAFKFLSHFMPFAFACDAMRETMAGVYTPDYITDILKLLCFVPMSLLLGLVLRNPLYRLNEFFENRLEDTNFMG